MEVFVLFSKIKGDPDSIRIIKVFASKVLAQDEKKVLMKDPSNKEYFFYIETHEFEPGV